MAKKEFDLTNGRILNKLLLIAGPVMATQVFQMAYNLIDMFFVGRISSDAVAATGSAACLFGYRLPFLLLVVWVQKSVCRKIKVKAIWQQQNDLQGMLYLSPLF